MSEEKECRCHEHGHHHGEGEECHCHDHDHGEHERTSIEEAGGCAAGFTGTIENFNTDAEMKLADALMAVGRYVQGESGSLLGHIKAAVYTEDGKGITLNLIDMDNGVEHHGTMPRADRVKFNFMCAVLDVDEHELTHEMMHAIDDSGLDYKIDPESLHHHDHDGCDVDGEGHHHHHHDHDGDGECHCHEHGHHHGEGGECHCHDHEHHHGRRSHDYDEDGECQCHHHDHHHHDHDDGDDDCGCGGGHHHDEDGERHCHGDAEKKADSGEKKGFFSRLLGKGKKKD